MDVRNLGEVIASRKLCLVNSGKPRSEIIVKIGKPVELADSPGDFYCPFQVIGIGSEEIRYAVGGDAVQALQLVMVMIGAYLSWLNRECGGKLRWDGGKEGELGFPVPA